MSCIEHVGSSIVHFMSCMAHVMSCLAHVMSCIAHDMTCIEHVMSWIAQFMSCISHVMSWITHVMSCKAHVLSGIAHSMPQLNDCAHTQFSCLVCLYKVPLLCHSYSLPDEKNNIFADDTTEGKGSVCYVFKPQKFRSKYFYLDWKFHAKK